MSSCLALSDAMLFEPGPVKSSASAVDPGRVCQNEPAIDEP